MNSDIRKLDGYTFVFIGDTGYFKTDKISDLKYGKFVTLIKRLYEKQLISDPDENKDSPKAIKTQIINTIENNKSIEINNLTGRTKGTNKDDAVARLSDSNIRTSADSNNEDTKKKKEETDKEIIIDIIDKNTSDTVDSTIDSIDNSYNSDYFKIVLKAASVVDSKNTLETNFAQDFLYFVPSSNLLSRIIIEVLIILITLLSG